MGTQALNEEKRLSAVLPKVTIMIPTYGQAHVVGRAIGSALEQDYPELEVIVSDDASPDDTTPVVARRADRRLRYHRNETNLGRVGNYRKALYEYATGDWVVNLDGDDYFTDPGFISAAMNLATRDAEVVIVAARACIDGISARMDTSIPSTQILDGREVTLKASQSQYHFVHLASLYQRARALQLDFYREDVISSDWESLYRLACHGKVAFLDRVVGVWCVSTDSASQTLDWRSLARNTRIWASIGTELVSVGVLKHTVRRAMEAAAVSAGRSHAAVLARAGNIAGLARYVMSMESVSWRVRARLVLDVKMIARLVQASLGAVRT